MKSKKLMAQSEQKRPESRHRRPRASSPLYFFCFYSFFGSIFQIEAAQYESSSRRTAHHAPVIRARCLFNSPNFNSPNSNYRVRIRVRDRIRVRVRVKDRVRVRVRVRDRVRDRVRVRVRVRDSVRRIEIRRIEKEPRALTAAFIVGLQYAIILV